MPHPRRVGREAEDRAAEYLLGLGYTIVTRGWATRGGELDLVALDGETLVFVEVKARRRGVPEDAVDPRKIARLARAAEAYLREVGGVERPSRFDVVTLGPDGLRHHVDAFLPWSSQDWSRAPFDEP